VHVVCRGQGSPAVVFESGIAASSLNWAAVQPPVASFTHACTYDRAGLGWSDAPSRRRTLTSILGDFAAVLSHADARGPVVLVGHSFGCFVVRTYAAHHPDRVAGIVLVDPPTEWLSLTSERARLLRGGRVLSDIGALLAHLGVVRACLALLTGGAPGAPRGFVRIFGPTAARTLERIVGEVRKLPPDVHPVVQAVWCQPKSFRAMKGYFEVLEREGKTLADGVPPPDVPVIVISSADQPTEGLAAHRKLAEGSTSGRHVIARRSAHWIQFDEPELIVDSVRDVVEASRTRFS
jgi:pimeloyl-ACP methyl ester carboxylesterase